MRRSGSGSRSCYLGTEVAGFSRLNSAGPRARRTSSDPAAAARPGLGSSTVMVASPAMRLSGTVTVLAAVALALCGCWGDGLSDHRSLSDTDWEVRVDLRRLEVPVSTYVEATRDRGAERFSYSASRLVVFEHRRGALDPSDVSRLESLLRSPELRTGLLLGGRGGDGLEGGDLAQVWAVDPWLDTVSGAGFVHRFSGAAAALIDLMVALGATAGDPVPAAAGYARSEPIDREQRRAIERRGLVTIVPRDQLPAELAAVLAASWERPGAFVPLDAAAVALFEARVDVGREIFAEHGGTAHQTALFLPGNVR